MRAQVLFATAIATMVACYSANAQTEKSQIIYGGGTGEYKTEIVSDASLQRFTVYRPQNIKEVVAREGRLPVILYGNGGCANNNVEIRLFLNEVVSHGYIAVAIGPYDEVDPVVQWKSILEVLAPPKDKHVVFADGEVFKHLSEEEQKARMEKLQKQIAEEMAAESKKDNDGKSENRRARGSDTYPKMLLEAMDWLTEQNADPNSEYYHCIQLDKVVAMGQSCGGAQALAVAHDPRISTLVILNSGLGGMNMQGATSSTLSNLHCPILYLVGGPEDGASANAKKDYAVISDDIPTVLIDTKDGHSGTFYEKDGGAYAVAARKWLDWQLKGQVGESALFLDPEYSEKFFPEWTVINKNF